MIRRISKWFSLWQSDGSTPVPSGLVIPEATADIKITVIRQMVWGGPDFRVAFSFTGAGGRDLTPSGIRWRILSGALNKRLMHILCRESLTGPEKTAGRKEFFNLFDGTLQLRCEVGEVRLVYVQPPDGLNHLGVGESVDLRAFPGDKILRTTPDWMYRELGHSRLDHVSMRPLG